MVAVGWIVLNRLTDAGHPATIADVILERRGGICQWVWVCEARSARPSEATAWKEAQAVARELLTRPPPDPTNGALWIRQHREGMPDWGGGTVKTAQIGNHFFLARAGRPVAPAAKERRRNPITVLARHGAPEDEPLIPARLIVGTTADDSFVPQPTDGFAVEAAAALTVDTGEDAASFPLP